MDSHHQIIYVRYRPKLKPQKRYKMLKMWVEFVLLVICVL